ncbi:hypothetical protein [Hydrogeniiclostridium mannosilyticum]|nr:hypothetical protein [Hydrogeniiclostridium mannosilyticum]
MTKKIISLLLVISIFSLFIINVSAAEPTLSSGLAAEPFSFVAGNGAIVE